MFNPNGEGVMVGVRELRIGNYVAYTPIINRIRFPVNANYMNDKFFIHTLEFSETEVCWYDKNPATEKELPKFKYYDISPIPITKEWLERLGFETDSYRQEFKKGVLNLDCEYTDRGEWMVFTTKREYVNDVKYIHQLQNLYYALTGEELALIN